MRTFAVGLGLLGLAFSLACGGAEKPPATDVAAPPVDSAGAASAGDPYASFDAGTPDEPIAQTPSDPQPAPSTDLGAECQQMAALWEKRARPAIKACYREGKKSDRNLMGTARITVEVMYNATVKPAKLDGPSSLGDDVANCMVGAVSKTAFPESVHCKGKQLTIPVEFPSRS